MEMNLLKGVVTPMVTPFDKNEELDLKALRNLTSRLITMGVSGLFPCGTTGEGNLLSLDERKTIASTVVDETGSRVPVYVQTGCMRLKDTIELSQHALDCGADGVGIVTPSYYSLSQKDISDYYRSIARSLPESFPIYLYSIPGNTLNDIAPSTAEVLAAECPNIVGIKYSGDDFVQLAAYTAIRNGRFSVLAGNDRTFAAVLAAGCDGTVSGLSNLFTGDVVSVYTLFCDGRLETAMETQLSILQEAQCLFEAFFLASLKAAMEIKGMSVGKLRKPLPELTSEEYRNLKVALSGN